MCQVDPSAGEKDLTVVEKGGYFGGEYVTGGKGDSDSIGFLFRAES